MLYNNHPFSVESDSQQIEEVGSKPQPENSETKAISKRVWIRPMYSAFVTFLRQKDKTEENIIINQIIVILHSTPHVVR